MPTAAEANRLFYADNAGHYEASEFCTYGEEPQRRLASLLERAVTAAGSPTRILDAGGGSGNAASHLVRMGYDPLVVDVSPEMAAIWDRKAASLAIEPRIEVAPLEEFLTSDSRTWDVIVFSSVLHHLDDPRSVLEAAAERLAPGGTIATIFDPTIATPVRLAIRRSDYILWLALHHRRQLASAVARRLSRDGGPAGDNIGAIAERHAVTGIDDDQLVSAMQSAGLEVVAHERGHQARFRAIRALARLTGTETDFSLLLRKPA